MFFTQRLLLGYQKSEILIYIHRYQLIKITYSICKMLLNKCYTNQNIARLKYQNNLAIHHYFYT